MDSVAGLRATVYGNGLTRKVSRVDVNCVRREVSRRKGYARYTVNRSKLGLKLIKLFIDYTCNLVITCILSHYIRYGHCNSNA